LDRLASEDSEKIGIRFFCPPDNKCFDYLRANRAASESTKGS
jgi:hypothetical protein